MGFFVLLHMHYHRYQNPAWIPTAQLDTDESSVAPLYLPHRLTCVMPQVLISHTLRPNECLIWEIPISQMCFSSQMGIRWSQSSTWGKNVEEAKVQWYPQKDNVESRDGISLRRKNSLEYLYSSPLSWNANPLTIHAATRPYHMICQKRQDEKTLLWHASGYYFCCD